ncbi:bifunctional 2',3'-cyclic-nucleotide 2'-phosphodiesterase/3'-nucleotidase [Bhargavaea ginsengi]|uniref:bifunctional 2',3'-cyclic-nucleotide 2'-phosphodiesterase/3'-nucleotidase n=1 Tax=Bhargavaea ginsengi TaxID=426757 RepID=UPI003C73A6BE
MNHSKKAVKVTGALLLSAGMLFASPGPVNVLAEDPGDAVKLRILETTDTHSNLFSYDYYKGAANENLGLLKVASAVEAARTEVKNSVLVDNGDTIQGTPLGTYYATVNPVGDDEVHPVIKLMNLLDYDAAVLGNHEFNYGLDFLEKTYEKAEFPYLSANVYKDDGDDNPDNDELMYEPYEVVDKEVTDEAGNTHTIQIGYIGFVAPQIVNWDKSHLDGKVISKDITESAEKYIPEMKEKGADVIIAMAHSGFDKSAEAGTKAENAVLPLSQVEGVDAITFSHAHDIFPAPAGGTLGSNFMDGDDVVASIDAEKGTINGIPATEAGYGGEYLGVIDLTIEPDGDGWKVTDGSSEVRAVKDYEMHGTFTEDIKPYHEATVEYTETKIGTTTSPIHSYFALVQDDPSIQIVTEAQKAYAKDFIELNAPEYKETPILSVGAPFKAGRNGAADFTDIAAGDLTIRSAADLYLYDNTLKAVLLTGSQIRDYLDRVAANFNTIDPDAEGPQELLNPDFRSYNFDVIDGLTYQFDITKPAKYDADGNRTDAEESRVTSLVYDGKPVDENQEFVVVMNNYRQSGNFPHVAGAPLIVDSAEENRQVLMDYISEQKELNPAADNNWSIVPIEGDPVLTFKSSPEAEKYATDNITYTGETDEDGFGIFTFELGGKVIPGPEPIKSFPDVSDRHWAKSYIDHLTSMKIVKGFPDGTFGPEKPITRGQFMSMTVRSLGLSDGTLPFEEELDLAIEAGITNRTADNFGAANLISREQMAAMVVRAYSVKIGKPYEATAEADYLDGDSVSPWFEEEVNAAYELGFMTGSEDGNFNPQGHAVRAHAAKVISLYTKK